MSDFSHANFSAKTRNEFRAALVRAIRADQTYYQAENGIERHGVYVNGRKIYYAADTADGHARVLDLVASERFTIAGGIFNFMFAAASNSLIANPKSYPLRFVKNWDSEDDMFAQFVPKWTIKED